MGTAVTGQITMKGAAPGRSFTLTLAHVVNGTWADKRVVQSNASGAFGAAGLVPGDYQAYFYNEDQRDVIGYWTSRVLHVVANQPASFPGIDFAEQGLQNLPAMDAHVSLPASFSWQPPAQPVVTYRWRLHSTSGRTFDLLYQSAKLDGATPSFSWDGAGVVLDPKHRYFWGVTWDAGAAGEGGNLFQAVYLGTS